MRAIHNGARLFAGSAMRLLDCDILSGLRLPIPCECSVVILVEFPCGIVRNVQQRDALPETQQGSCKNKKCCDACLSDHLSPLGFPWTTIGRTLPSNFCLRPLGF